MMVRLDTSSGQTGMTLQIKIPWSVGGNCDESEGNQAAASFGSLDFLIS